MNTNEILKQFDEKFQEFAPDGSSWGCGLRIKHYGTILDREVLDDIKAFISTSIHQAIAEERARVVYEIKGLMKVSKTEWTALDDLLASLDKPLNKKD